MKHQRGSVSIGIVVALFAAAAAAVVVVVVVVKDDPDDARPSVTFKNVTAEPAAAHVDGYELGVEIELEVTSGMPHVAPHVQVAARCDGNQTDEADAFFMSELTLSLTEGATPPQKYCFQKGWTTRGACTP